MKVAIYIEQGVTQLVLTPESDWEKSVAEKMLPDGSSTLRAYRGSFYECQGGWVRQGQTPSSVILRVDAANSPADVPDPVDAVQTPFSHGFLP